MTYRWDIRCCECGQFIPCFGGDQGVMHGGYSDYEPPPAQFFCDMCAEQRMWYLVKRGNVWEGWWTPPDYVTVAKSILRHRRKRTARGTYADNAVVTGHDCGKEET